MQHSTTIVVYWKIILLFTKQPKKLEGREGGGAYPVFSAPFSIHIHKYLLTSLCEEVGKNLCLQRPLVKQTDHLSNRKITICPIVRLDNTFGKRCYKFPEKSNWDFGSTGPMCKN